MEGISGVLPTLVDRTIYKNRRRLDDDSDESSNKLCKPDDSSSSKLCNLDDSNFDDSFGYGSNKFTESGVLCSLFAANLKEENHVLATDPNLCRYLCECALDWLCRRKYELYEYVSLVSSFRMNLDAEKTQTHNLHIIFKAYSPDDKTTQTFRTTVLFRVGQSIQIVIASVGQDRLTPENFFDFPVDHLSDSDDDEDYGSDCEVSQLNPAFLKVISKGKSPEKSPEKGPTYDSSLPQHEYKRQRPGGLYDEDPELIKEIECFETDVDNSGGFEVGYYPLMDRAGIYGTWICKYYDIENKSVSAFGLTELLHLSQLALCFYNIKEGTKFGNVKVLRATTYCPGSVAYNITFEASSSDDDAKIFQTNVCTSIALPVEKIMIAFVRIKPN